MDVAGKNIIIYSNIMQKQTYLQYVGWFASFTPHLYDMAPSHLSHTSTTLKCFSKVEACK